MKRGVTWRLGFLLVDAALLLWFGASINAMRLFTIWKAPTYVPGSVIQYWWGLGAVMGATLVLVAEFGVFSWRVRETALRRFPGTFPLGRARVPEGPPPPPAFSSSGR
ncbi:MAG: hypothetical protein L3K18_07680 [Thermoplasmata archaeon]|nr:hypothetical protein [Thermoplasmata archaeon]